MAAVTNRFTGAVCLRLCDSRRVRVSRADHSIRRGQPKWGQSRSADRAAALPGWLPTDNKHRTHTALGGLPPITRCANVSGQYA